MFSRRWNLCATFIRRKSYFNKLAFELQGSTEYSPSTVHDTDFSEVFYCVIIYYFDNGSCNFCASFHVLKHVNFSKPSAFFLFFSLNFYNILFFYSSNS